MSESTRLLGPFVRAAREPVGECDHYRGLRIHATEGLHEFVAAKIQEYLSPPAEILDLGAGTGAMSLRLRDAGYQVAAADLVQENFRLHGDVPFFQVDLNERFAETVARRFDGIIAMELIEHLENPRQFVRECLKALRPCGRLVVTTPNIDNSVSKASFVRDGTFQWFTDRDYREHGHITPISQWQFRRIAGEAGSALVWMGTHGNPSLKFKKWWKIRLTARLIQLVSTGKRELDGEILVAVLQQPLG